jgi:hypothetical protein
MSRRKKTSRMKTRTQKVSVAHRAFRCHQDLHNFENNHRSVSYEYSDTNFFNGQAGPCTDKQSDHLSMLKVPPVIWYGHSGFPEQADEQHEEKRQTECTPVDEAPRHWVKAHRWKQGSKNEKGEVAGKACLVLWESEMLLVQPGSADQHQGEDQRYGMKLQKAAYLSRFAQIVRHVVSRQPKLAEPHVQKKNCEKAGQVEHVLFDWHRSAERGSRNAQRCS